MITWQKKQKRKHQRRRRRRQSHTSQEGRARSADLGWQSTRTGTPAASAATQNSSQAPRSITLARRTRVQAGRTIGHIIYTILLLIIIGIAAILYAYSRGSISLDLSNYLLTAALSLFFPFVAFSYMLNKGMTPQEIVQSLGLSRKKLTMMIIGIGIVVFFALFTLDVLVNLASSVIGTTIDTNAGLLLQSAPIWFYIFTAIIAPINEEIFFRGFLVPRIGIILSALIFGVLHASYNSTFGVEIIAAVIFGLIAGYVYKRTNSLYASIIAHILINSLAILSFAVI